MAIVLPETAITERPAPRTLYGAGEWKVAWREAEPRRVMVVPRLDPRPAWAEHEWQPDNRPGQEDIACRAVLRALVAQGFEAEMVDDALGTGVRMWADHPSRTMEHGGFRNQLMAAYNALRAHLSQGGYLRDVPIHTCEMVFAELGSQIFSRWLVEEYRELGPFPPRYRELVEDLWQGPHDPQTRIGERKDLH